MIESLSDKSSPASEYLFRVMETWSEDAGDNLICKSLITEIMACLLQEKNINEQALTPGSDLTC